MLVGGTNPLWGRNRHRKFVGAQCLYSDYADFRCRAAGFFAAASFASFLPWIGISISLWPAAAFRGLSDVSVSAACAPDAPSRGFRQVAGVLTTWPLFRSNRLARAFG